MADCACCGRPAKEKYLHRRMCSTCYNHHIGYRPRRTRSCEQCYVALEYNPVDWVVVVRACEGERLHLTRAERTNAVVQLTRRGLSQRAIASRLGVTTRTVARHRAKARAA